MTGSGQGEGQGAVCIWFGFLRHARHIFWQGWMQPGWRGRTQPSEHWILWSWGKGWHFKGHLCPQLGSSATQSTVQAPPLSFFKQRCPQGRTTGQRSAAAPSFKGGWERWAASSELQTWGQQCPHLYVLVHGAKQAGKVLHCWITRCPHCS